MEAPTQNNSKSDSKSNETQAQREVLFQEFHEFQEIGNPLSKPLTLEFYQRHLFLSMWTFSMKS